jgi:hypothetical protein
MQFVDVWIEGTAPLLQHRFHHHDPTATPQELARDAAYWDRARRLCFPGGALAQLIRRAARMDTGSRDALAPSAMVVLDDMIPLFALDRTTRVVHFEIDARSVVMPSGQRVLRYRPRIDAWCAPARLCIDEQRVSAPLLREWIALGGSEIGIGDFRPERGGPFGTFRVVECRERGAASMPEVA